MEDGIGQIETGGCIASISGQGMAAAAGWDGKIELQETVGRFRLETGMLAKGHTETFGMETMELVKKQMADSMGKVSIGAFSAVVDTS